MTDRERTPHLTTQAFGLALISVALLAVLILTLLVFDGEDITAAGSMTVVAGTGTFLLWRRDAIWRRVLGLLITIAAAMGLFYLAFGVFQPFSPVEFLVGLVFLLGVLYSLIGGTLALVRGRKGSRAAKRSERMRNGALVLIGVGAVVSIGGFLLTRSAVSEAEAAGAITLDMVDFEFVPEVISASVGRNLLLTNSDAFVHDFTVDDLDIYVHLGPGSEALVDLSGASVGAYRFYCSLHSEGTDGMAGTITIEG